MTAEQERPSVVGPDYSNPAIPNPYRIDPPVLPSDFDPTIPESRPEYLREQVRVMEELLANGGQGRWSPTGLEFRKKLAVVKIMLAASESFWKNNPDWNTCDAPVETSVGVDAIPVESVATEKVITNEQGGKQARLDYFLRGLPPLALLRVSRILKEGAAKYEADPFGDVTSRNWHKISSTEHLEHVLYHVVMELMEDKSGEDHAGHLTTRAMFFLHQRLVERGEEA